MPDTKDPEVAMRMKQYEGKLATLTAINGVLQSENDKLKQELEQARNPTTDAEEELAELKEEFAERLGEADAQVAKLKVRLSETLLLDSCVFSLPQSFAMCKEQSERNRVGDRIFGTRQRLCGQFFAYFYEGLATLNKPFKKGPIFFWPGMELASMLPPG